MMKSNTLLDQMCNHLKNLFTKKKKIIYKTSSQIKKEKNKQGYAISQVHFNVCEKYESCFVVFNFDLPIAPSPSYFYNF